MDTRRKPRHKARAVSEPDGKAENQRAGVAFLGCRLRAFGVGRTPGPDPPTPHEMPRQAAKFGKIRTPKSSEGVWKVQKPKALKRAARALKSDLQNPGNTND